MVTVCLVLGGADCLFEDIRRYGGPADAVVACNDAGAEWPGRLDAWVTLHPEHWERKGWLSTRAARRYPNAVALYAHNQVKEFVAEGVICTDYLFPGQDKAGSSGLFAAKVALIDLGFDQVVFCGVPMTHSPHFFGGEPWRKQSVLDYRKQWKTVPDEWRARMRSMSGWSRTFLGGPNA